MSNLIVRIWSLIEGMETIREEGSVGYNLCGDWE